MQVQVETTSLFRFVLRNSRIGVPNGGHEPYFCVKRIFLAGSLIFRTRSVETAAARRFVIPSTSLFPHTADL